MDLLYRSDFWLFYNDNRTEIERIIDYHANRYRETVNINDMRQEIILRLASSDALIKYDPAKATLKTYIVHKIRGHASHFSEENSRNPPTIPIESYDKSHEKESNKESHKKDPVKHHVNYIERPSPYDTIENTLLSEEIMEILEGHLDKTHYLIACLYLLDCYTCKEIYQHINKFSYNTILIKINSIKSLVKKIIKSNHYISVKRQRKINALY